MSFVHDVCDSITLFPGWHLHTFQRIGGVEMWWTFPAPCIETGSPTIQSSRVWLVKEPTTRNLVTTAHLAAQQAMAHEVQEFFRVGSARPFDPHKELAL